MPTIRALEKLLDKEPDDVFLNFSLAMALWSAGRKEDALQRFDRTLTLDPHYVPAHFQKGRVLADLGRIDESRETLERGAEIARETGDDYAAGEMEELLEALED